MDIFDMFQCILQKCLEHLFTGQLPKTASDI